jgi:cell division protein FtsL
MADKKIALDLEVNIKKGDMTLGELNKQLETLGTTIDEQKEILIEFERELLELESIQSIYF